MIAAYKFSINSGPDLPMYLIDSFRYDERGRVVQRWTHGFPLTERWREERYAWSDGNIVLEESFSGTGQRELIVKNRFDTRINYRNNLPTVYQNPGDYSANNIVWSEVQDFTGLYDPICSPCKTEYRYNNEGYPIEIEYDWDETLTLRYE